MSYLLTAPQNKNIFLCSITISQSLKCNFQGNPEIIPYSWKRIILIQSLPEHRTDSYIKITHSSKSPFQHNIIPEDITFTIYFTQNTVLWVLKRWSFNIRNFNFVWDPTKQALGLIISSTENYEQYSVRNSHHISYASWTMFTHPIRDLYHVTKT